MRKVCLVLTALLSVPLLLIGQSNTIDSQSGFGYAVSIQESSILVGEPQNRRYSGRAYLFVKDSMGNWTSTQTFEASDGVVSDNFGSALLLSDNLAFVSATGAREDDA